MSTTTGVGPMWNMFIINRYGGEDVNVGKIVPAFFGITHKEPSSVLHQYNIII